MNDKIRNNGKNPIQSIKEWENIFNELSDMITIHDREFNIIYSNTEAVRVLGLTYDDKDPAKCYSTYHGAQKPPEGCPSCRILKDGRPAVVEFFEPHFNKWVEMRVVPRTNGRSEVVGSVHLVRDITERREREDQLRESREKLANLTAHLQRVRESERQHIAREIHDELGQELALLNMDVLRLRKDLGGHEKTVTDAVMAISTRIDRTIRMVQKIVTELRPVLVDKFGLKAALEWQAEEFENRTGIACNFIVECDPCIGDKDKEVSLFRIFQEILTNVMRHSEATCVQIRLGGSEGLFTMEVSDNGRGIRDEELSNSRSFGIMGMHERVSFLGGTLRIRGTKSRGTTITVSIPLQGPCREDYTI